MQKNELLLQMLRRRLQGSQTPEIVDEDSAAQSGVSSSICSVIFHCSTLFMNSLIDTSLVNMLPFFFFQFHELHRPPPSARFLPGGFAEKPAVEQEVAGGYGSPVSLRENHERGSPVCGKKKVTFDMNIKTYEAVANDEDPKHFANVLNGGIYEKMELPKAGDKFRPNSSTFPSNHRYQNCDSVDYIDIGDEDDEDEYEDCDSDEQDYQAGTEEDESYESFFRLSGEKGQGDFHENRCPDMMRMSFSEKLATSSVKAHLHDRSQYANSVLNSVENMSMHKEFEVCADPIKNTEKENINSELKNEMVSNSVPVLAVKKPQMPTNAPNLSTKKEISLDASLSSWLVSSDNSTFEGPQESYSHRSHTSLNREGRPILGALTVEGIIQSSYLSSSRKFPRGSPGEIPVLDTAGSNWNCQRQVVDSASEMKRISSATRK